MSSTRKLKPMKVDRSLCSGPQQMMVKIEDKGVSKVLCLDMKAYDYLKSANYTGNNNECM